MATQNEELLKEIAYLKRLNKELSEHIFYDDVTQFPWLGNLGHWFWDLAQNVVTFNPLKCEAIGYKRQELPDQIGFEFFTEKLHPEDYQRTMDAMLAHMKGESPVWEVKYRIKAKDGSWKVFYDRGKITQQDANGTPLFLSGIVFDVTEAEIERQEVIKRTRYWQHVARYDRVTNLYTRKEFERQLTFLNKDNPSDQPIYSLMMVDVDHFKQINDNFGHLSGDQVLNQIGLILKEATRSYDIISRFGGDEFVIILPEAGLEIAEKIAMRIQKIMAQYAFVKAIQPTLSIGIASIWEVENQTKLLELADKRLYKAKNSGRNLIVAT